MAILNWENLGDKINDVIEQLRDYARIKDRTARSMAANRLGDLLVDIDETAAAEAATRPDPPAELAATATIGVPKQPAHAKS